MGASCLIVGKCSFSLGQRWPGRPAKRAQPARSTLHTALLGFANRFQHQHQSCPLLEPAHAYWPGTPSTPGSCSLVLPVFYANGQAANYTSRQASKTLNRLALPGALGLGSSLLRFMGRSWLLSLLASPAPFFAMLQRK